MADRERPDDREVPTAKADPAGGLPSVDETAVGECLVAEHGAVLDAVAAAADAVATDDRAFTDGRALAAALERELADAGVLDRLPAVLATAADAAGLTLAADPVAAPPYVTVTSRGPVLRGPTPDGRLVVVARVFRVERSPRRYVRDSEAAAPSVTVAFRPNGRDRA